MRRYRLLVVIVLSMLTACAKHQESNQGKGKGHYQSYMHVGDKLYAANDKDTAQVFYQRAQNADPKALEPKYKLAKIAKLQGHYPQAEQYYRAILNAEPNALKAKLGLANTYIQENNIERAVAQLNTIPKSVEATSKIDNSVGVLLDKIGAHWSAQKCYMRGLRHKPAGELLWNNIATSYLLAGNYEKSLEVLEKLRHFPRTSQIAREKSQAIQHYLQTRSKLPVDQQKQARMALIQKFTPGSENVSSVQISKAEINKLRAMCS